MEKTKKGTNAQGAKATQATVNTFTFTCTGHAEGESGDTLSIMKVPLGIVQTGFGVAQERVEFFFLWATTPVEINKAFNFSGETVEESLLNAGFALEVRKDNTSGESYKHLKAIM